MAEEFSLGEALGLQTGLPPQGDLGITRGIQTSINADLRRQMMEAQMGNRRQMMQQRMQQMMNRSAQKKFYAPSVARRWSDAVSNATSLDVIQDPMLQEQALNELNTAYPVLAAVDESYKIVDKAVNNPKMYVPAKDRDAYQRFKNTGDPEAEKELMSSRYFRVDPETKAVDVIEAPVMDFNPDKIMRAVYKQGGIDVDDLGSWSRVTQKISPSQIKDLAISTVKDSYDADQIKDTRKDEFNGQLAVLKASNPNASQEDLELAAARKVVENSLDKFATFQGVKMKPKETSVPGVTFQDNGWWGGKDNDQLYFSIGKTRYIEPVKSSSPQATMGYQGVLGDIDVESITFPPILVREGDRDFYATAIQYVPGVNKFFVVGQRDKNKFDRSTVVSLPLSDNMISTIIKGKKGMSVESFKRDQLGELKKVFGVAPDAPVSKPKANEKQSPKNVKTMSKEAYRKLTPSQRDSFLKSGGVVK